MHMYIKLEYDPLKTVEEVNFTNFSASWLVGCFGFNRPFRQYFSLYRAVSQREGEEKRIDR